MCREEWTSELDDDDTVELTERTNIPRKLHRETSRFATVDERIDAYRAFACKKHAYLTWLCSLMTLRREISLSSLQHLRVLGATILLPILTFLATGSPTR